MRRKPGPPPFNPTPDQRLLVMLAKTAGFTNEQIAQVVNAPHGISVDTLTKYFPNELARGDAVINMNVVANLYKTATSSTHKDATTAAIFWAKSRLRWRTGEGASLKLERGVGPNGEPPTSFTLTIGDGPKDGEP
ncbi:MAG TPA: hypothetical protein VI229_00220 [Burkholderiales bacterium]